MSEIEVFRLISLLGGVLGLAVAIGMILAPRVVSRIEKGLDKDISTEKLEKILNERRNLTESLLRHPRVFGFVLLSISFLLLLANLLLV